MFHVNGLVLSVGVLRNVYSRERGWVVGQLLGLKDGRSTLFEGVEDGIREYFLRVIEIVVFLAKWVWI